MRYHWGLGVGHCIAHQATPEQSNQVTNVDEAPDDPVIEELGSKVDQAMNVDDDSDHDEVNKPEFGFEDTDDEDSDNPHHDDDSSDGLYD